jgi:hypothetical protein
VQEQLEQMQTAQVEAEQELQEMVMLLQELLAEQAVLAVAVAEAETAQVAQEYFTFSTRR